MNAPVPNPASPAPDVFSPGVAPTQTRPLLLAAAMLGGGAVVSLIAAFLLPSAIAPFASTFAMLTAGAAAAVCGRSAGGAARTRRHVEDPFRIIADNSPAMIWASGPDGACTYTNRGWRDFTGAAMAECLGPGWSSFIHPDDQAEATRHFVAALRERRAFELELRLRRHDGEYRWCRFRAAPHTDGAGGFHGFIAAVFESHDLHEVRTRLGQFVEHAPAAIAMFDQQMRYIAVSRRWIADYKLKSRDVLGKSHNEVFPSLPEKWKRVYQRCLAGAVESCTDDVWRPDGWETDQHLRWEVRPWRHADGTIGGIMMCVTDITEEKRREGELARLCGAAEAASRAKSEFLANMSHEIRTPLTAIMGYTDLLRDDGDMSKAPERRVETIETIRNAGQHLMSVINNILDLSKIEADRMAVTRGDATLSELLREVDSFVRPRAAQKCVELNMVLETPIPERVVTEPTFLRQILTNLTANAVKFTDTGSVTVRIAAVRGASGDILRVDIEDTGPGLTPEQAAKLFQPFSQGDSTMSRRFGGTGLGLTISRRLAQLLGGNVTLLRSAPGSGSVFRAEVPLEPVAGSPMIEGLARQAQRQAPGPRSAAPLSGRILLAEDGSDNQRLIRLHLTRAGATVDVADNGAIALLLIEEAEAEGKPYSLLVTDMQMPEMDGYTLARTLRARGSTMPIVALTAHAMAEDRQRCLDAGCDDYDSKPIDRDRMLATCRRWLGVSRSARAA